MLQFLCGLLLGGFVGVFVMALIVGGQSERGTDFWRDYEE